MSNLHKLIGAKNLNFVLVPGFTVQETEEGE